MSNPRAEFSSIFDRKPLKLPGGARVAVWPVINVEEWDINEPMARTVLPTPQGVSVIPDIPNFGWFDYGLRVGFWRMKQVLDNYGIRATVSLNASVCNSYPLLVTESMKSGWEMLAHGRPSIRSTSLPVPPPGGGWGLVWPKPLTLQISWLKKGLSTLPTGVMMTNLIP